MNDKIVLEGINSKGFGIIQQSVMQDPELSIEAKGLYSYFASYTGSGSSIFPKRETILKDLKLSKNSYYKHYNSLINNGYLRVNKMKGYMNRNVYTLVSNPKKIKPLSFDDVSLGMLTFTSHNAYGFGFIPKAAMTDDRLSIKEKALLSYFYSLVGAGAKAFPKKSSICAHLNISVNSLDKYLKQLRELDYINVKQRKSSNGKFSVNDYYLNDSFGSSNLETTQLEEITQPPSPKNEDNCNNPIIKPFSPHPKKGDNVTSPYPKNEDNTKNRTPKIVTLPHPKFEDNINSNRLNSNTVYSILPSRDNVSSTQTTLSTEDEDYIYSNGIDLSIHDSNYIKQAIQILCRTYEFNNAPSLPPDDKMLLSVCDILCDMATCNDITEYSKQKVSSLEIRKQINKCLTEDEEGLCLKDFLFELIHHYRAISKRQRIQSHLAYLKSVIWQMLCSFPMNEFLFG